VRSEQALFVDPQTNQQSQPYFRGVRSANGKHAGVCGSRT